MHYAARKPVRGQPLYVWKVINSLLTRGLLGKLLKIKFFFGGGGVCKRTKGIRFKNGIFGTAASVYVWGKTRTNLFLIYVQLGENDYSPNGE